MTAQPIARVERPFSVDVTLPGSKSIALRHILMSTLADGPTRLVGVPRCDDVDSMFDAVGRLSVDVQRTGKHAHVVPPAEPFSLDVELDLGMSGVSLRLLLAQAALRTSTTRFTGHRQLHDRPNADLLDALRVIGCEVEDDEGRLPIVVRGPATPAPETPLAMGVSSQYLSGLLLMAPSLPRGLTIHLRGSATSASYVGVTQAEMARRGVEVRIVDPSTVTVPPGVYQGGDVVIEGDASAATYHAALATLHGGRVHLANLGEATRQGDYAFLALCERIGATVDRSDSRVTIEGPHRLRALGEVDMIDMPDAAPTLMAMAPLLPTATHITGGQGNRPHRLRCRRVAQGRRPGRGIRRCGHRAAVRRTPVRRLRDLRGPPSGDGAVGAREQDRRLPRSRRGLRIEDLRRLLAGLRSNLLIHRNTWI
ncbi:MAG: hypothetical protein J4F45_11830 [Pseudomonadales bacterium]|nr:hypothetical protein [Pseudomonadales bacterium]